MFLTWFLIASSLVSSCAAMVVAAGFFGLAYEPAFRWLIYAGGVSLLISLLLTAVGLLRNLRSHERVGRLAA
jgi:hypothetical protein